MIQQTTKGLNSRSEANPFDQNGMLPLITAPMYSVVDETNYQIFLDNKIQVCLPRNISITLNKQNVDDIYNNVWISTSLQEFQQIYCVSPNNGIFRTPNKVCIDTANGNIPALHDAIRKAKQIHGDSLIIMAGNVGSVEAFCELAKTGVDYIRVGIGGGGGCNTTSNTGVGQEGFHALIRQCAYHKRVQRGINKEEYDNIKKVKIVADGISSFIKYCEKVWGYNDNGYAAINKLLFSGADLVMIGSLFAQSLESAGDKRYSGPIKSISGSIVTTSILGKEYPITQKMIAKKKYKHLEVRLAGMSTQEEQKEYKEGLELRILENSVISNLITLDKDFLQVGDKIKYNDLIVTIVHPGETVNNRTHYIIDKQIFAKVGESMFTLNQIKPSEGSVKWIPVRWTLDEWLNGSDNQDQPPYLMGWINSIKSAMAYTEKTTL